MKIGKLYTLAVVTRFGTPSTEPEYGEGFTFIATDEQDAAFKAGVIEDSNPTFKFGPLTPVKIDGLYLEWNFDRESTLRMFQAEDDENALRLAYGDNLGDMLAFRDDCIKAVEAGTAGSFQKKCAAESVADTTEMWKRRETDKISTTIYGITLCVPEHPAYQGDTEDIG